MRNFAKIWKMISQYLESESDFRNLAKIRKKLVDTWKSKNEFRNSEKIRKKLVAICEVKVIEKFTKDQKND